MQNMPHNSLRKTDCAGNLYFNKGMLFYQERQGLSMPEFYSAADKIPSECENGSRRLSGGGTSCLSYNKFFNLILQNAAVVYMFGYVDYNKRKIGGFYNLGGFFMFKHIGGKIKTMAKVFFWLETALVCIFAFMLIALAIESEKLAFIYFVWAITTLIAGPVAAWISNAFIYGFGELIEKTCVIAENTKPGNHAGRKIPDCIKHSCGMDDYSSKPAASLERQP